MEPTHSQTEHVANEESYEEHAEGHEGPHEVKTLLSWSAPGRPFKQRGTQYLLNLLIIVFLISVILFLFKEFLLIAVVCAVAFLAYMLATVPPHNFHYRISTEGVMVEDHFFLWEELYDFYFMQKDGMDVLHVGTKAYFPGELVIVLGDIHKEHVKSVLLPFLPFREYVKPTFMEKTGEWLGRNFPLEETKRSSS